MVLPLKVKITSGLVSTGLFIITNCHSATLQENLAGFVFPKGSTLIQYVNDLLVCSTSKEICITDTNALLKCLASQGHKALPEKLQLVKQVHYISSHTTNKQLTEIEF